MKEIKAIIQPFILEKVLDGLREIEDLPGITVSEEPVQYVKKSKIEVVIPNALVERVVRTIQEHAHTGNLGDGKIFVYEVADVIRIRTGECGEAAI